MSSISTVLRGSILLVAAVQAAAQLPPLFPGRHIALDGPGAADAHTLRSGDFNGDGVTDLLVVSIEPVMTSTTLSVLLGRPEGGYGPPIVSPMAGTNVVDVAVCDLGGDPWLDVAGITNNQRITVAHGTGNGSFVASYEYFAGNGVLTHVAVGDLHGTGFGDVISAVGGAAGTINVNAAAGNGGYLATQTWATGHPITSIALVDLDGDGWLDLVASAADPKGLSILRNDGAGGFLPPQDLVTPGLPIRVFAAALDGDADVDLLVVASGGNATMPGMVQSWLNDGAGGLQLASTTPTDAYPVESDVQDMDADGDADVATGCWSQSMVDLLLNDGAAHFALSDTVPIGTDVNDLLLADATGDGVPDVVASVHSPELGSLATIYTASAPGVVPSGDAWFNGTNVPIAMAVGLVNGDLAPDVVLISKPGPTLVTLLAGDAGLQAAPVFSPGYLAAKALGVGDLDGDGLADVVTSPEFDFVVSAYVQVGRGRANGSFALPQNLGWGVNSLGARRLALGDIDGDGWKDIAALVPGSPATLVSFRNDGTGTLGFDAPQLQPAGKGAQYLASGDLDDDGLDDVVVLEPKGGLGPNASLFALLGSRSGVPLPGPNTILPTATFDPLGLALGDLDFDGRLDAVVGTLQSGQIAVAYGNGAGGLLATAWYPAKLGSIAIAVADVDGDGWPDVLHCPDTAEPGIVVRLGNGSGGLQPAQVTPCAVQVKDIAVADVTQDGRPDLLVACEGPQVLKPSRVQLLPDVAEPFTWKDLGSALAGATGAPVLHGTGALDFGTAGFVRLTDAQPSSPAMLLLSASSAPVPFKGGTLVPFPPLVTLALPTGANGTLNLAWTAWPSNLPGQSWYFQFGVQDGGAVHGVALSNAISGTEP